MYKVSNQFELEFLQPEWDPSHVFAYIMTVM